MSSAGLENQEFQHRSAVAEPAGFELLRAAVRKCVEPASLD